MIEDDENREMPGRKDDENKPRWDLLPHRALASVVAVLTHGAARYGAENWRRVPEPRRRYYAAALRHLTAWWMSEDPDGMSELDERGEVEDPDSGLPHLAHAVSCLLFLLELELAAAKEPRIPRRELEGATKEPCIPRRELEVLPAGRHLAYARGVAT